MSSSSEEEVEHGGGSEGHQICFILNCHLYANSTLSTPSAPIIGLSSLDLGGLINTYEAKTGSHPFPHDRKLFLQLQKCEEPPWVYMWRRNFGMLHI